VAKVQSSIQSTGRAAKPGQFHATLAFLGMQHAEWIPAIREVASHVSFEQCTVVMDHVGRFGRAGVLWLGADRVPEPLMRFQHNLVDALLAADIGYDRKAWKFHVTLYRKMRKAPLIMNPVSVEWSLDGFDLIESVSVRSGVEYHSIGHWKAQSCGDHSGDV
ncbi:RNA 2',3'-cyclic phosphodiesterase, partial [Pseudomonadota bacterium]